MTREESLNIINEHVKNANSIKHMLATEAIMKAIAGHFDENVEEWSLAGLLHDLDMEKADYRNHPELHGPETVRILLEKGVAKEILDAILAHNEATGKIRETLIEKCLYAVDPLTGLIVASALVLPNKKLADVKTKSIIKRFKEPRFAAGANREAIKSIESVGLSLEQFIEIGLKAMQEINADLGL